MIIISKSDLEKKLQVLDQDRILICLHRDEELETTKLIVATLDLKSVFACDEIVEVSYES